MEFATFEPKAPGRNGSIASGNGIGSGHHRIPISRSGYAWRKTTTHAKKQVSLMPLSSIWSGRHSPVGSNRCRGPELNFLNAWPRNWNVGVQDFQTLVTQLPSLAAPEKSEPADHS